MNVPRISVDGVKLFIVPSAADTFEQLKSIVSETYLARKFHLVFTLK